MYIYNSKSEQDTINFAKKFAKQLQKGNIVVLSGNLGSGKTKFVQGILDFFELSDEVSSPTFTIVNEYQNDSLNIYHFDVYRLIDVDEFFAIGGEEYLLNGICLIEWGEKIENVLPKPYTKITFQKDNNDLNIRKLIIEERK